MSEISRKAIPTKPHTSLGAILIATSLCSFGTGVVWNGMPFIAEHDYDFGQFRNLTLSMFLGITYLIGAFQSGKLLRYVEHVLSPRSLLILIVMIQAVVCMSPLFFDGEWVIWVVIGCTSLLSAFLWPVVESYLTAGRHGADMRAAIGWWNIIWTGAVTVSLIFMAPLMGEDAQNARFAIVVLGGLNAFAGLVMLKFQRSPGVHDHEISLAHVGSEYTQLLRSARVLLPLSYLLLAAISPIMPYRLGPEDLAIDGEWKTPLTAIWMAVRVLAIACMWRLHFWHGKWGILLLGGSGLFAGFALIVAAPNLWLMILGLALFGGMQGIIYYTALYYAMSVGRAKVDAGGTHEGLIGIGYAAGPAAVMLGLWLGSSRLTPLSEAGGIITVITCLLLLVSPLAIRPYLKVLKDRS